MEVRTPLGVPHILCRLFLYYIILCLGNLISSGKSSAFKKDCRGAQEPCHKDFELCRIHAKLLDRVERCPGRGDRSSKTRPPARVKKRRSWLARQYVQGRGLGRHQDTVVTIVSLSLSHPTLSPQCTCGLGEKWLRYKEEVSCMVQIALVGKLPMKNCSRGGHVFLGQ